MNSNSQPVAFSYLRVSHKYSAASGLSPGSQLDICRRYYKYAIQPKGVLWYGIKEIPPEMDLTTYDDTVELFYDPSTSARHVPLLARRAGARLDQVLREGDHVIFAHLDRGFRAIRDFSALIHEWLRRGIIIHFADLGVDLTTPHGMLVANLMASMAQGQSDLQSERQKEICARMKELNMPHGGHKRLAWKTIGKKGNRQYVPDQEGRAIMAEIVKLHDRDRLSFGQIGERIYSWMCQVHPQTFHGGSHFGRKRLWTHDKVRKAYHDYFELVEQEGPQANYLKALHKKSWEKRVAKGIATKRQDKKRARSAAAKAREAARKAAWRQAREAT